MDNIHSRTDVTSITGAELNLVLDWTEFVALDSSVSTGKFVINKIGSNLLALNASSTKDSDTFDQLVLASTRMSEPLITFVDTDSATTSITNSANLLEVYVKPSTTAGTLSIELNGTISANQGQLDFSQFDSTTSNITSEVNSVPTGSISISGTVAVDETLTATHNLADADGIGVVSYQWLRDGADITGETNSTYKITLSDINKDITVKGSYTDGGGKAESSTSSAKTVTQSTVDKPLMFTSTLVTAKEASMEAYGSDYSTDPDEVYIRLTLEADMSRFADTGISSIAGVELDFNLDWSQFEYLAYGGNSATLLFDSYENYQGSMLKGLVTNDKGEITNIVATSMNLTNEPVLSLVDNVATVAGQKEVKSVEDLLTIYLNPKDTVKDFEVSYGGLISVNQGTSEFTQLGHSLEVEAKTFDALVSTGSGSTNTTIDMLKGISMNLWKGEVGTNSFADTTSSVVVDTGEISIDSTVDFTAVKLSANAYNFDENTSVNITDAIAVLRHIVKLDTLASDSNAFHAADVNNSDTVNITDAIAVLRHIVKLDTIDTFDLIDDQGARVTQLDAAATGAAPTWTLVANGDVNFSGEFADDYIVTSDLV
jgi:hypothetical protein